MMRTMLLLVVTAMCLPVFAEEFGFDLLRRTVEIQKERGMVAEGDVIVIKQNLMQIYGKVKEFLVLHESAAERNAWTKDWDSKAKDDPDLDEFGRVQRIFVNEFAFLRREGAYKEMKDGQILKLARIIALCVERGLGFPEKAQMYLSFTDNTKAICAFLDQKIQEKKGK